MNPLSPAAGRVREQTSHEGGSEGALFDDSETSTPGTSSTIRELRTVPFDAPEYDSPETYDPPGFARFYGYSKAAGERIEDFI